MKYFYLPIVAIDAHIQSFLRPQCRGNEAQKVGIEWFHYYDYDVQNGGISNFYQLVQYIPTLTTARPLHVPLARRRIQ